MPKKTKGKKGKGKKGKKGGKKTKKTESLASIAAASAKVWEAKLEVSERAKHEYRESAKKLMLENDALQNQMVQTERDTIDVITYLKNQDQDKSNHVEKLQQQLRDIKKEQRKEKEELIEEFSKQINDLEERLGERTREVELMHNELKLVKEFRRKRAQMQKELDEIKESMHGANRDHKATLTRMEQKFFEEKMRLQQEANQKIAELAEKAHTEAISNLDETTKSVYKENVRLAEALAYHMKEGDLLKKERERLMEENERLRGEKESTDMMVQEKVIQVKQQKEQIKELQEKVEILEQSLSHVVREFEREKEELLKKANIQNEAARLELDKLQRVIELRTREMNKVKRLARNILDQRTELERFFLESLDQVRNEISANQLQYRRDAHAAYQERMLAAHAGKGTYPKIRTFSKATNSTNSVFKDLEAAEKLYDVTGKVDIQDLTWEQKERVLRYLFAKMNGSHRGPKTAQTASAPSLRSPSRPTLRALPHVEDPYTVGGETEETSTFLTQQSMETVPPSLEMKKLPVVPDITPSSQVMAEPLPS